MKSGRSADKWLVFGLVAVGIFMSTLDGSIVNIALPVIMKEFRVPLTVIEWVVAVYLLVISSLLLSFGRLSDIRGRRVVYSCGLLVFSMGSLFCGLASSSSWLIASRTIQGLGAAMSLACTPAIIVDTFPPHERGRALGLIGAVVSCGLTAGPALGAFFISHFSWRVIFYVNVPIGLLASCAVFFILRGGNTDVKRPEPFDFPGAIFLAISLSALLLMITKGHEWGGGSVQVVSLFVLFVGSLAALVRTELTTSHPVLDVSLFRSRLFTLPLVSAVLLFLSLFIMLFLMPFYLMTLRGYPASKAGLFMVLPFLFMFVISPASGALADRMGSRVLCTVGMSVLSISLFLLSRLDDGSGDMAIGFFLASVGVGTAMFTSPNNMTIMNNVSPSVRGVAGAVTATARNLGMVLGIALSGTVFNMKFTGLSGGVTLDGYHSSMAVYFIAAFKNAMSLSCILAALGAAVAYLRGEA